MTVEQLRDALNAKIANGEADKEVLAKFVREDGESEWWSIVGLDQKTDRNPAILMFTGELIMG